ncbi:hypothetical protein Bca4012_063595 [Brassica carinata]
MPLIRFCGEAEGVYLHRKSDWNKGGEGMVLCSLLKLRQETSAHSLIFHMSSLQQYKCIWCPPVCANAQKLIQEAFTMKMTTQMPSQCLLSGKLPSKVEAGRSSQAQVASEKVKKTRKA